MKRLLPLLLLLLAPFAHGAAALVQSSGKQTAMFVSTNPTYTLTGVTAGDAIIVLVNYQDSSSNSNVPTSVSDGSGSYTLDSQINADNAPGRHTSASVYSFFNVAAGTHVLTFTRGSGATGVYWIYDVLEVSGLPTSNSNDGSGATNYGASTGPVNVGGSALSAVNGFAVVLSVNQGVNNPPSIYPPEVGMGGSGTTYTGLFTAASPDEPSGSAGYYIPSTTSALGADFGTITSQGWGAAAVYYAPSVTGSSAQRFFLGSLLPRGVNLAALARGQ